VIASSVAQTAERDFYRAIAQGQQVQVDPMDSLGHNNYYSIVTGDGSSGLDRELDARMPKLEERKTDEQQQRRSMSPGYSLNPLDGPETINRYKRSMYVRKDGDSPSYAQKIEAAYDRSRSRSPNGDFLSQAS
jgi:hypothetical protein